MDNKGTAFTMELLQKARACKSVEEILALAKESGREITEEEAKGLFEKFNPANGELSDEELDNVSGGGCGGSTTTRNLTLTSNGVCSGCHNVPVHKVIEVGAGKIPYDVWYCEYCDQAIAFWQGEDL